jgi:hypothetical protein
VTASDGVTTSVPQSVVIAVTNVVERSAVSVTVAPAQVTEGDANKLVYTFTRSHDLDGELTVDIGVTGTAGNEDYSRPVQSQWTRLMGASRSPQAPTSAAVGADGAVYVSGRADSSLLDGTNVLSENGGGYVRKFDADGSLVWTRLTDAVNDNYPNSVTTGADGGVYVAGMAYNPAAYYDGFVTKFDSAGALEWTSFVGGLGYDYIKSVSTDAKGAVYVAGLSYDVSWATTSPFLSKLDIDGILIWNRPVASNDLAISASPTTDSAVYVTGYSNSAILDGANKLGENGSYVSKFDASGTSVWTRLPESSGSSQTNTVSAGADGAVYVAGYAYNYSSQNTDGFVTKFDAVGRLVWTSFVGGSGHDDIKSVFTGEDGAVYLAGETYSSSLNGQVIEGAADTTNGFVGKFNDDGTLVWTHLIGGSSNDLIKSISVDADGVVYIAGETYSSSLDGQNNQGNVAGFVSKIQPTSLTQVTFAPGSDTATLTLPASADAATEGDENVTVTVIAGQGYTVDTASSATGTIEDNLPPVITSDATATAAENTTGTVYTATATDANAGSALTYSLSGTGADDALFEIDDDTGEVSFKAPPNYEEPADAGSNNIYNITVTASDGVNTTEKDVAITVTYVDTEAPVAVFSAIKDSNGGVLTAGPTTSTTLLLSGSNEPGSSVSVYNGSTLLGQATVTGTAWSYIVTASNGESYNLKITETDLTGNVSAPKAYLPGAGDAVIDLGVDKNGADYGQLIAPVQVDGGKWFYHWDLSRDGTGSDIDSNGKAADHFLGWALNDIFNKDVNGVQGPGTSETYRYATLNDVHLALPTMGLKDDVVATFTNYGNANGPMSVATLSGVSYESSLQAGTVIGSLNPSEGDNTINPLYNDLLAIWDAHNGNASTDIWRYIDSWNGAPFTSGVPVGWSNQPYTSASNSYVVGWGVYDRYQDINLSQGWIAGNSKGERDSEYNKFMVALEVFEPSIVIDTTAPIAPTLTLGTGVDNGATLDEATDGGGVVAVTAESGVSTVVTFSRNSATVSKSVIGNGDTPVPVTLSSADLSTLGDGTISVSSVSTDAAGNVTASTGSTSFELNTLSTVQVSTSPASANESPVNILSFVSNLGGLNWTTVGAYSVYSFTNVGTSTFTVNSATPVTMEALVVAGGAAGAWSGNMVGAGGGGGGVAYVSSFDLINGNYTVTVGDGATAAGNDGQGYGRYLFANRNGENSSFELNGDWSITVYGGGVGGGNGGDAGADGGSGGGGHWSSGQGGAALPGTATDINGVVFYGNAGGQSDRNTTAGGGGGGAASAGAVATLGAGGNGGEGFKSAITGTAVVYGSGGGGGGNNSSGLGGTNGGNATTSSADATSGVANTGGGGGGSGGPRSGSGGTGMNGGGGSGVVVLRYIAGIQAEAGTPSPVAGIQIGDPDATGTFTVTLTQTHGVLAVAANMVGGLATSAITGNNSGTVTLTGTLAQINATLGATNGVLLTMNAGFSGAATLTMATNDGQGGTDIDVIAVSAVDTTAPTATLTTGVSANTADATVQSTELGTAYLVKTGGASPVTVTTLASITSAENTKFNSVSITAASTSTPLSLAGLEDGTYSLYTVDAAGNLSAAAANTFTVDSTAPTLIVQPQYASSLIDVSSQYGTTAGQWSALDALGPPNTFTYGGHGTAWANALQDMIPAEQFIHVGYATPIYATGLSIRETFGVGFVRKVELFDASNTLRNTINVVDDSSGEAISTLDVSFPETEYLVASVKVFIDTSGPGYELIDSIALWGASPLSTTTLAGTAGNSAGETITLTLTFDGAVNGLTTGTDSTIFTVAGSGVLATWSGSGSTRTLTYIIAAGQNGQAAIDEVPLKEALIAGITDAAGNAFAYSGSIPNIDVSALPVVGTGFDAARDFIAGPTVQSADNIWQYFSADFNNSNISTLQLLSDWDTSLSGVIPRPQWDGNHAFNLYPLVQKQENGDLIIHPDSTSNGGLGKAIVVAWKNTTSSNVTVDLTGSLSLVGDILSTYGTTLYAPQPSYDGIVYSVTTSSTAYASGTPTILLQGALDEDSNNSSPSSTNLNLSNQTLAPGAMISVAVHGNGNFSWDFTQLDLQITPEPLAGQSVINLGSLGQLIAPVQVEGKWYYHLDRNGDGTTAGDAYYRDTGTYRLSEIYDLFKQDVNGVAGASTNDTYRYATVNGVKLAMPTLGTSANPGLINGTDLNSPSQTNPSYDDLSAIWDAYNGTRVGSYSGQNLDSSNRGSGDITSGAPGAWVNDSYVSATPWPSSTDYAALRVYDGLVFNHANWGMNVALQVL